MWNRTGRGIFTGNNLFHAATQRRRNCFTQRRKGADFFTQHTSLLFFTANNSAPLCVSTVNSNKSNKPITAPLRDFF